MRRPLIIALLLALPLAWLAAQPKDKPKRFALLVGVNNYEGTGLDPLSHTADDMKEMKVELENIGFVVTLLTNRDATKTGIDDAVRRIKDGRGIGDLVLVGLSGHGTQRANLEGAEDAFYCPYGCDTSDIRSLVSLTGIAKSLGPKGVNLVMVDACRNDPRKGAKSGITGNVIKELPANTAILFSCSNGQRSWETTEMFGAGSRKGHGVFFYHVLEGLRGQASDRDGDVTWNGLVNYVQKNVNSKAKVWLDSYAKFEAERNGVGVAELRFQSPHALNNLDDAPVLVHAKAAPIPKPMSPSPSPTAAVKGEKTKTIDLGNGVEIKLALIPAGKFWMGSPTGETDRGDDEEQHEVEISRPFYLGIHEVTQGQWKAVMGADNNPSHFKGDHLPVEMVSWDNAQEFIKKLNAKGYKCHLPSEAQWEYACRGGESSRESKPFHFQNGPTSSLDSSMANFNGNNPYGGAAEGQYREKTLSVGTFKANRFGLFDMHGNVWEWCQDYYGPYGKLRSIKDAIQLEKQESESRVLRGGSWFRSGRHCRGAIRVGDAPVYRGNSIGFRLALPLD